MGDGFLRMMGYLDSCRKNGIKGIDAIKILILGEVPEFVANILDNDFKKAA
jgi:hypothetical protein